MATNTGASRRPFLFVVLFALLGCAQAAPGPHAALYLSQSPGRDAKILALAKEERRVVVYTSFNTKDSYPIAQAFEKTYGVKLEIWRSSSEKVLQRAITEARAGRTSVDAFELDGRELEALYREGLLEEFWSPHFKSLPPAAFPKHRHYVADRFNFFTIAYNTRLVKPDEVPSSYEDLAQPRWAGRLGIEAGDTDWFASIVKYMGEEKGLALFRRIAAQKPQVRTGHTLINGLVASGEVPLAAAVYNHAAERLALTGAPIRWKALAPTFGRPNGVALAKRAERPHAALLFADFMLSPEGQQLIKAANRVPASTAVQTTLNQFSYQMIDPAIVLDESPTWEKIWSELFLQGRAIKKGSD